MTRLKRMLEHVQFVVFASMFYYSFILSFLVKCPENTCSERYLGETARRLTEKIIKHAGKDNKSHMVKQTLQSGHPLASPKDFRILQRGSNSNKVKRKISEVL